MCSDFALNTTDKQPVATQRNECGPLPSGSPLLVVQWKVSEQDGSHTGGVVLCWGLVEQARHEHMSDEH